ncbi:CocE/NonD family hydrolase [Blastococcus sp. TBT05-19]|uniref:CocE/NonD family hydrolase n=1 Tax=Blastococcus sp. TBT05-19 TaxID=2250581 RepID=UPI0013147FE3|nr:CocE/NonD family hydrolase [Blastococcus sp. TBT05-19]
MRRVATVLLSSALAAGGLVTLAPAAAATPATVRDLTITVTDLGPEKRTCKIDADLHVPHGVTAENPGPALLVTNGFGGTKDDQDGLAQGFGEHGYVTLSYTGLGFVDGDLCPITLDDVEHDGAAASQLLRFLGGDPSIQAVDDATGERVVVTQVAREDAPAATSGKGRAEHGDKGKHGHKGKGDHKGETEGKKPTYDPQVGMIGGSYGGQIQFAAAAAERRAGTDRLDAIVPTITWNDLSYSLAPENSALPGGSATSGSVSSTGTGVFKYQWAALFTALGVANGVQDLPALTDPEKAQQFAQQNCANFEPEVCRALAEVALLGYPSADTIAFLRSNSVASYMAEMQVPALLMQGQADTLFNLQESVATYTSLRAQGTPVSLVWQSFGHSNSTPAPGEMNLSDPENSYLGRQALAWLDHYVRGQGPAPGSTFSYFRDWALPAGGSIADAYAVTASYPLGSERTFHLSSTGPEGGALVDSAEEVGTGTSSYSSVAPVGPNYTETSALDQQQPVTDPDGTAIRFSTGRLSAPLDVVGSPRLTVKLDAPSVELTQRGGPAGQLVAYAKLYDIGPDGETVELPNRLISPVRITDATKPVTIELPGIVHRFEEGHQLAVVLAGGDLAYRGATLPQPVSLTTGTGAPQTFTIPVVG